MDHYAVPQTPLMMTESAAELPVLRLEFRNKFLDWYVGCIYTILRHSYVWIFLVGLNLWMLYSFPITTLAIKIILKLDLQLVLGIGVALPAFLSFLMIRRNASAPFIVEINEHGLINTLPSMCTEFQWSVIKKFFVICGLIFVQMKGGSIMHVIPRRAFASDSDFRNFADCAQAYLKRSRDKDTQTLPTP